MVKLSLILVEMPGSKYYARRGLKKPFTIYVRKETYDAIVKEAKEREWSLQTLLRRWLEEKAKLNTPPPWLIVDGLL